MPLAAAPLPRALGADADDPLPLAAKGLRNSISGDCTVTDGGYVNGGGPGQPEAAVSVGSWAAWGMGKGATCHGPGASGDHGAKLCVALGSAGEGSADEAAHAAPPAAPGVANGSAGGREASVGVSNERALAIVGAHCSQEELSLAEST